MNIFVIFFVVVVSAVAHAATVRYDLKGIDSKKGQGQMEFQATKPSIVETSSHSSQEDMQVVQMNLQSNLIADSRSRNNQFTHQSDVPSQSFNSPDFATNSPESQDFQRDESLFHSQQPNMRGTTISAVQSPQKDQFNEYSFQPGVYADDSQSPNQQQFYNMEQQTPGRQQFYNDKERASDERYFLNQQRQMPNRDQFYTGKEQSQEQQQFFNNMQVMGMEDQHINNNKHFQSISNQQSQIRAGKHSTQIQTQGVMQLSAFNNREQPIVLPRQTAVHSSSVVVSGLRNLPLLPAMVYNTGSVPSAYTRGSLLQGGASVRQHMQTPYVRYVYSHLL